MRPLPYRPTLETKTLYSDELWSKLLKGGDIGDYIGAYFRVTKGNTRSLDPEP